jgi:hypothetical protein
VTDQGLMVASEKMPKKKIWNDQAGGILGYSGPIMSMTNLDLCRVI